MVLSRRTPSPSVPVRHLRPTRLAALACAALLPWALLLAAAPAAQGRAHYPSTSDVRQARTAAGAKAAQVRAAQAELAQVSARVAAARLAAEVAAESYDAARIRLAHLAEVTTASADAASRAEAAVVAAQQAVGRLAALDYQQGGRPSLLDVLFTSQDPQDLLDRTSTLAVVADGRVEALHRLDEAQATATAEHTQAAAALAQQQAATTALASAQDAASSTADDAVEALAEARGREETLLAQLATLERTTVDLERRRQAGLAQDLAPTPPAPNPAGPSNNGSTKPRPDDPSPAGHGGGAVAVAWAERQIGLPYRWGGAGPDTYDCSGLTMRAWQQAGVDMPHYAESQYTQSQHVVYGSMQPGDLIFYATDTADADTIHHVAMYIGGGRMIEAPFTGAFVRIVPIRWNGAMPWAARP